MPCRTRRTRCARAAALLVLCLAAPTAADELRLEDGEILFGAVRVDEQGRYVVDRGDSRPRRLRTEEVAERIEGEAPHEVFDLRLGSEAEDPPDGQALLEYAWRHRLDTRARALAARLHAGGAEGPLVAALAGDGWPLPKDGVGAVGPRWGSERRRARSAGGGGAASEKAARAALDWLVAHQDDDGRLDADGFMKHDPEDAKTDGAGGGHHGERVPCPYDGVTTAVAVLAWLGDGSTSVSGRYAAPIAKGLGFLRAVALRRGVGFDSIWNTAFATHALADAYTVTRDPELRPALEQGVQTLLATQLGDGGWRYMGGIGGVPSTSVAAVALGAARRAGVSLPRAPVEKLLAFLDARVDAETGRSEYHDGAERLGYTPTVRNTASALAARGMLGTLRDTPGLDRQLGALTKRAPRWKIEFKKLKAPDGTMREFQIGTLDPYAWYFTSLALALHSSGKLKSWYRGLQKALRSGQRDDGSFAGSWDPLGTYSDSGGRVFVTGLCVLMLQAPYRY